MKAVLGILCAVLLHAGFILFGGVLFNCDREERGVIHEVDLLSGEDAAPEKEKDTKEETPEEKKEEMETEVEAVPDVAEVIRNLELSAAAAAPALDAASLGAIEQALNGQGSGGDFSAALSFSSGGRIGGTGTASSVDEKLENAFTLAEIDQKPRPIFQAAPSYPAALRGKKFEGVVTVLFVVDASGKVVKPRVERSTNPAFEKPALDAVKQWKFEPAIKGGQRVGCKMRVPIRFQPS